jgi:hypothetical protein
MNDEKLKQLFESARRESPPSPTEEFDARILRAVQRESRLTPVTFWDQLEVLFPRLAVASLLVVGICFLGDYCYSIAHPAGLMGEVSEVSEQWLFASQVN